MEKTAVITPIFQPPGSSLCGQACVAMAAGISLEESIKVFGHGHATITIEVSRALNSLGIQTDSRRLRRISKHTRWPSRAIVKEIYGPIGKRKSHWVLFWNGKFYDPYPRDPHTADVEMSSYLRIYKPKNFS